MATEISNGCPYKGLQPYTEEDRDYFFGRERDRETIASNLFAAPLTILYGSSGVGKSSVLQAGAIPQLRQNQRLIVALFGRWQGDSFDLALKTEVLAAVCENTGKSQAEVLQEVSKMLDVKAVSLEELPFDDLLTACARAFGRRILVIFDQFEEYFLYHAATSGSEGFDAEFARAVNQQDSGVNFMLAMREEELSKLDRFRARIPTLLSNLLRLDHLDREAATSAIRKPLDVYNEKHPQAKMAIEDALVEEIISQVKPRQFTEQDDGQPHSSTTVHDTQYDSKIETPFLQMVLVRLWNEERSHGSAKLRLNTFQELGGAKQIARAHLDKVMEQLSDSERDIAASVLRFLVTPKGSKIALDPATLAGFANQQEDEVRAVLTLLSSGKDMRILRKVTVPGQSGRYELFHDVLGPAILEWRARYVQAQQLVQERAQVEQAFSLERQRRMRQGMSVLVVLLILMAGVTVYAFQQSAEARRQSAEARKQEGIAQKALGEAKQAQEELEKEKKKVETERDRANDEAIKAGNSAELAKSNEKKALAAKADAVAAQQIAETQRQLAETQRKRANEQEELAKAAAKIKAIGLKGFDATRAGDMDEAIKQFGQARDLYRSANDQSGEAYALVNIAESQAKTAGGLPEEALKMFDSLGDESQISEKDQMSLYSLFLMTGTAASDLKKAMIIQNRAIESFKEAIRVTEQSGQPDLKSRASIYRRIGDLYLSSEFQRSMLDKQGNDEMQLDKVAEYYINAAKDYNQIELYNDAGSLLARMGFLSEEFSSEKKGKGKKENSEADEFAKALKFYEDAQAAFARAHNKPKEALVLTHLGEHYKSSDDAPNIQKAIGYYQQAAKIYLGLDDAERAGDRYAQIGELYAKLPPANSHIKEASENYEMARSAFHKVWISIPPTSEERPDQPDEEEKKIDPEQTIKKERGMLTAIANLYKDEPNRNAILDQYFAGVIESFHTGPPPSGTVRLAETLDAIGALFNENLKDKQQAIKYYGLAAKAWNEAGEHMNETSTLLSIGSLYASLQDEQNTRVYFEKIRTIFESQAHDTAVRDAMSLRLMSIAEAYAGLGQQRSAFEAYDQAFRLYDQGSTPTTHYRVMEIARAASKVLSDEQEAAKWFQRLLDYYRQAKDSSGEAEVLKAAGNYYSDLGNTQKAMEYYKQSFSANRNSNVNQFELLKTIGRLYLDQADENGAATYFQGVLDVYRKASNPSQEADALGSIASSYRESGRKHEAINYYTQALQAQCKLKVTYQQTSTLNVLSSLFRESGETQEANRLSKLANNLDEVKDCDFKIKKLAR